MEKLNDLVVQMKASVQWQRLFGHEAQGNTAFGRHFYESAVQEQAHLDSQFTTRVIRLYQAIKDPAAALSDKERSEFLKKLNTLLQQVSWLYNEVRGY